MDKQTFAVSVTIVLILGPVIFTSYAMTAKSAKVRARGYYGLSSLLFLAAAGCFAMAVSGENRAGFAWMVAATYGAYWAWGKARSQGSI